MSAAASLGATGTDTRPHVVVVGAGFAGISAVRSLRKAPVRVTLIDRHSYSTFQPLLYQVATGALNPGDITYGARSFVSGVERKTSTWVTFRKGVVTEIDPDAKVVTLDVGPDLTYDYLILANGVTTNYFGVPGARESAYPIYTRAEALAVRDRMMGYLDHISATGETDGASVVVVGGGATGVEMAGTLAELRNSMLPERFPELDPDHVKVILLEMTDKVLGPFDAKLRRYAANQLRERGVELRLGTAVAEVRPDRVVLKDGEEIPAQMTIWATGVAAHDTVKKWGLTQGRGGRIVVDSQLRVPEHPEVFVAGDIGVIDDNPLPQLAQPAIQTGAQAAKNLVALIEGRAPEPFKYFDKGTMATIGRRAAVAEIAHGPKLTGTIAWLAWMFVHIFALLGNRNRIMVSLALTFRYIGQRRSQLVVGD
ncbi:NAD(P)/FAD-dependent oxidoreductase [Actinomycetospora sp. NBRC 106378]|uniref:NAD(P)/FAD-dependent oxidoreductase n=1 Tax=Actinomycetospora sp. NBRC 106378 TaxID=3032208 RepID=UPI0024A0702B|nr:NAD(P)/FAD-dependent oxidoreductase [Actinomycetospora sp. NBRC 106378]GLZ53381.1 6-phosphogluconate dehydrogenase [Actinomycetospora sp. NBRC 106378]